MEIFQVRSHSCSELCGLYGLSKGPHGIFISLLFQILDLSAKFVMVNAGDDDEPSEEVYKPDGGYIPR